MCLYIMGQPVQMAKTRSCDIVYRDDFSVETGIFLVQGAIGYIDDIFVGKHNNTFYIAVFEEVFPEPRTFETFLPESDLLQANLLEFLCQDAAFENYVYNLMS